MYLEHGFIKVAAVTPKLTVGAPKLNAESIVKKLNALYDGGVRIAVTPELSVTGYTAMDLIFSDKLLSAAVAAIKSIAEDMPSGMIAFVGAPIALDGRVYDCAVAVTHGKVLGITPKKVITDCFESRYFTPAFDGVVLYAPLSAPMGRLLYRCDNMPLLTIGCEIGDELYSDIPPSAELCRAGATAIANLAAAYETTESEDRRRLMVKSASLRSHCLYISADAGEGESTTDVVYSAHNLIAQNGECAAESAPFCGGEAIATADMQQIDSARRHTHTPPAAERITTIGFTLSDVSEKQFTCPELKPRPFVPEDDGTAEKILTMQAKALKKRFVSSRSATAVIGISGGLDSSLALLVCVRALGPDKVSAITMPCFGTTSATRSNAGRLCRALGVKMRTVDIKNVVTRHLKDIEHSDKDVVFENAQARVRTMTLFDIANKENGLVIGTGDLSEIALGWCTYNGDHMSSYDVNAGVTKTLVRRLVRYEGDRIGGEVKKALYGILTTPVSPELLPPDDGKIAQKTEDILGPYDLHDFILYYHVRYGFKREKIDLLMSYAFPTAKKEERGKALDVFYRRFRTMQFKRSCSADGVKICEVSLSPRGDWRMPSDLEEM